MMILPKSKIEIGYSERSYTEDDYNNLLNMVNWEHIDKELVKVQEFIKIFNSYSTKDVYFHEPSLWFDAFYNTSVITEEKRDHLRVLFSYYNKWVDSNDMYINLIFAYDGILIEEDIFGIFLADCDDRFKEEFLDKVYKLLERRNILKRIKNG